MGTSKLKVYLTVGISASGKTSWAKTNPIPNAVYITRDDIRFNFVKPGQTWADYKFNKENERAVSDIQKSIIDQAVKDKKNIVIVDTNLSNRVREYWKDFAAKIGYDFEIIDFECSFEEAVKRDNLRANGVGQSAIRKQYKSYLEYSGFKFYVPDETKPDCIVVDIDGTIAEMSGRTAFEWDKVDNDKPRQFIIDLVLAYAEKHKCEIVFLSGRDSVCRDKTEEWIKKNVSKTLDFELYMRKSKDNRKDYFVKKDLFFDHVEPAYNVKAVFDDRPQVVRLWHNLKIENVICVGEPFIEF